MVLLEIAKLALKCRKICLEGESLKKAFYGKGLISEAKRLNPALTYKVIAESFKRWKRVELVQKILVENLNLDFGLAKLASILLVLAMDGVINEREVLEELRKSMGLNLDLEILRKLELAKLNSYPLPLRLAIKYSVPKWFVKTLLKFIPSSEVVKLLQKLREEHVWIRVNTLKISVEAAIRKVEKLGVDVEEDKNYPILLRFRGGNLRRLALSDLARKGYIIIQDKASVISVYVLDPKPDETILDACAAPGIKTTLIAQLMENRGRIIAVDYSFDRLLQLRRFIRIMGVKNVEILHADSRVLKVKSNVDKALVDAPCTSSGALSKDPSLHFRLLKAYVSYYSDVQFKLLRNICVQAGETLYCVCSLLPEEGEIVVDRILDELKNVRIVRIEVPEGCRGYRGFKCSDFVVRLFPHIHDCNGFFMAKLALKA